MYEQLKCCDLWQKVGCLGNRKLVTVTTLYYIYFSSNTFSADGVRDLHCMHVCMCI